MYRVFTILLLLLSFTNAAMADEIRPGYLELNTSDGLVYSVKWKVPMKGDLVLSLNPILPDSCSERIPPSSMKSGGAMITRWSLTCATGIYKKHIRIDGLENTMTDVLVRVVHQDGVTQMVRLTPSEPGFEIAAKRQPSAGG